MNTAEAQFIKAIEAFVAERELERIKIRIRRGMEEKTRNARKTPRRKPTN
jgi:DNA invertase Pin-like site-specific DNA recombinase